MSKIRVLFVDDNPADVDLTLDALQESGLALEMNIARDGQQALDFLHRRGAHAAAAQPDIVLLDLNLPGVKGGEVLADMRADERLRPIPVIVLTSSARDQEIRRLYEIGANCCLTKPLDQKQFAVMIVEALQTWLAPPAARSGP